MIVYWVLFGFGVCGVVEWVSGQGDFGWVVCVGYFDFSGLCDFSGFGLFEVVCCYGFVDLWYGGDGVVICSWLCVFCGDSVRWLFVC